MTDETEFAEVYRGNEPVEAQMLEDVLGKEGFTPRLLGTRNAALMGAGQSIMTMRIEVPVDEAEEARSLLDAVLSEPLETPWGEDDYEEESHGQPDEGEMVDRPEGAASDEFQPPRRLESGARPRSRRADDRIKPRNRVLAVGLVAVMPGISQVYGGRPWAGLLLMAGLGVTFVVSISRLDTVVLGMAYLGSFVVDIIAGQRAVTAANRGQSTRVTAQLLMGLAQIVIVLVFAYGASRLIGG